jgi:N-acetylglucosamine transport system substrate-binding protein
MGVLIGCGSKDSKKASNEVEIAMFKGGYGTDFFEKGALEFEKENPGLKFNVWGDPRIWEQLRPRFNSDDVPDFTWPGWDMDYWALLYENQVVYLDKYLDQPAYKSEQKWRDTFEPSILKLCTYKGKVWKLPYHYMMYGWWYEKGQFDKLGIKPPKNWTELLAVCEKLKKAGITPITHQGKYPAYIIQGVFLPWAISAGGEQVFRDIENLTPGAWKNPAFLKSAKMIMELVDKGYLDKDAPALSHTEAQMEFLQGRAAMIPCGTWLHSEMEKSLPANFNMVFFLPPVLDKPVGDPTALSIGIEPFVLPTKSKHPQEAIDFYKYMTSEAKAKQFVEEKGSLVAIKGCEKAKIAPYLADAMSAFKQSKTIWTMQFTEWYPTIKDTMNNAMTAMLMHEITPEEMLQKIEDKATEIRNDKNIVKHKSGE